MSPDIAPPNPSTPPDRTGLPDEAPTVPTESPVAQPVPAPWSPQVIAPTVPSQEAAATLVPPLESSTTPWPSAAASVPPAQPIVASSNGTITPPPFPQPAPQGGKGRKKLWLSVGSTVGVLLLAGGLVFGYYLPNTPGGVYKAGLSHTAKGYDKLLDYMSAQQGKHYKGYSASGSLKIITPEASGDGNFTAQSDGANSTGQLNVDLASQKFAANFRTVEAKGQDEPDLYFQVSGLKPFLDSYGLNSLDSLDGQWISVDHTLIESAVAQGAAATTAATTPSYAQIQDALKKIGAVNKQYLFATDKGHAVLVNEQYLGKSTQDGRPVNGYKMGYNKANLKSYVGAVGRALNDSSLNAWVKQTTGKSTSEALDLADLQKSIDSAKSNYTFTLYVDTKTKLIHKLHFPDASNPVNSWFETGLGYTGGSKYPFFLTIYQKEGSTVTNVKLQFTLDTSTNEIVADIGGQETGDGSVKVNLHGTFKPSNSTVQVTAPAGAKPIVQVLQSLGLGDLLGATTPTASANPASIYGGTQAKARDTERQTDLKSLQGNLEAVYASDGEYPTLSELNNTAWRQANMPGLDSGSYEDPQGSTDQLAAAPTAKTYSYQVGADGQSYTLTAELESGQPYVLKSFV